MTLDPPTDFPAADAYQSATPDVFFSLPPMMIAVLVLLLLLAAAIGWAMARRRSPTDDPSEAIYDAIKKAIAAASGASRDQVIGAARRLKSVIDNRLGAVIALSNGVSGPCADLDQALEGLGPDDDHGGEHEKPDAKPSPTFVVHAKRDVTIHAVEPAKADTAHDADGHEKSDAHGHAAPHGSGHGASNHGHGHGHGHGKPVDARTQVANVRAAVHALSDHWNDKSARLAELRAARRQLTSGSSSASGSGSGRIWDRS